MRKLLIKLGLWIARLGGWREQFDFSPAEIEQAMNIVKQVEEKFNGQSGSFKRAQAMRPLLNVGFTERRAGKIIEYIVEKL